MKRLQLPFVLMPREFVHLLKSNLNVTNSPAPVFDPIRSNRALYLQLEQSFHEFDDGRGVEKVMLALGWENFRERMASLYLFKSLYGNFPVKTNMELVEDIKYFEERFQDHSLHGNSRLFLLGFYLKLANFEAQRREEEVTEIKIPERIQSLLKLSQGRSERIDWLIIILSHLLVGLGEKPLIEGLSAQKKFHELFQLLAPAAQDEMLRNLLAYGASIHEPDVFLYEKV